ncbi:hypothetical protein A2V68_02145 [candidate division Kazan bacterium RBG_13_50_9]|uniref:Polymerase nucleotidyl transferase domain-containing protein n=1 Tax=candidate division Kazan bacterium RBG_13_50_9 TaxID=1798535 RepID=A0A1F4NRK1_UNCK3|nr:MAG: hypothetical protein A2V68_02145 [candidate division Kazan bacterium RBG_13_50_9]
MEIPRSVLKAVESVVDKFKPLSVFLYGSGARRDAKKFGTDYEMGVIYRGKKISRMDLVKANTDPAKARFYPFDYKDFRKHKAYVPFIDPLFFYELLTTARTLAREKIVETLPKPSICVADLIGEIGFEKGFAFAAFLDWRNGDLMMAKNHFSKSCLFGARCLIILHQRKFPASYTEIIRLSKGKEFREWRGLLRQAMKIRLKPRTKLGKSDVFDNMAFLSSVREAITEVLKKKGNIRLL